MFPLSMVNPGGRLAIEGSRAARVGAGEGSAARFYCALYSPFQKNSDHARCVVSGRPCPWEAGVGGVLGFRSLASASGGERERFFSPCVMQGSRASTHWC